MKKESSSGPVLLASLLAASLAPASAHAQATAAAPGNDADGPAKKNRFRLAWRPGFNVSTTFKNLGSFSRQNDPGPATPGVNHYYDDGYNLVDSADNRYHVTWYWGYENASQVPGDDFIYMHSISSNPSAPSSEDCGDLHHGLELSYQRHLARTGRVRWGLEAAVNYTWLSFDRHRVPGGEVDLTTDAYALSGVIPPAAPYQGTFEGPVPGGPYRPVISDIPHRTMSTATVVGQRGLDADLLGFRLGPSVELPLSRRLAVALSGGLAVAGVWSDFSFQDVVTGPGTGQTLVVRGKRSDDEWLIGGYVGGNISYAFTDRLSAFAGAQYQNVGHHSLEVKGRQAKLDLSRSVFLTVGLGYSF